VEAATSPDRSGHEHTRSRYRCHPRWRVPARQPPAPPFPHNEVSPLASTKRSESRSPQVLPVGRGAVAIECRRPGAALAAAPAKAAEGLAGGSMLELVKDSALGSVQPGRRRPSRFNPGGTRLLVLNVSGTCAPCA
jgi:hypothetical protein